MNRLKFDHLRLFCIVALLSVVTACAPVRTRGTSAQIARQQSREEKLALRTSWNLESHFAVSDGHSGGSGTLSWQANGLRYSLLLRAPVTGKTVELQGGPGGAVLTGLRDGPIRGEGVQALLADEFGWYIPVDQLTWWVRGLRAPGGPAEVRYGKTGLPSLLQQDGWSVEYRDWYADSNPPLPRKIYAAKPPYSVRLLIEQWRIR